jgi:Tfp pilus assembly protein PilF
MKLPDNSRYEGVGGTVEGVFQLVDVMPTVLQILGISAPDGLQGQGLLASILGKRSAEGREAYSETYYPNEFGWNELRAWRSKDYKYILGPRPELYHVSEDPQESSNLINKESALANQFKARLLDFEARYIDQEASQEAKKALSEEDLERFRSLGYVGSPTEGRPSVDLSRPDPKDKIEEYTAISRAMTLIARRDCGRALPILTGLRQKDPSILSVDSMIGQCYLQAGRYQMAKEFLRIVVESDPQRVHPQVYLAQAHFHLREYDEARALLEGVVQQDQDSFQAYNLLGLIYSDQGETARALDAFNRAVSIQDDAEAYQMLGYLYTKESRPKEAAEALEHAIRLDPNHALAHLYLANAYMLMGQRDLGERAYRKALALDPSLREKLQ